MGTIPPQALMAGWTTETITVEMAIGHLIQHVLQLHTAHQTQVLVVAQLRREIEHLAATTTPPATTSASHKKRTPPHKPS